MCRGGKSTDEQLNCVFVRMMNVFWMAIIGRPRCCRTLTALRRFEWSALWWRHGRCCNAPCHWPIGGQSNCNLLSSAPNAPLLKTRRWGVAGGDRRRRMKCFTLDLFLFSLSLFLCSTRWGTTPFAYLITLSGKIEKRPGRFFWSTSWGHCCLFHCGI